MAIGLEEALSLTRDNIKPLSTEDVQLVESLDRTAAADLFAMVDSPSNDSSLKDGYAVLSSDVEDATPGKPVCLRQTGYLAAGGQEHIELTSGTTARVLTGACVPAGADAIVSEEFVNVEGGDVWVTTFAEPGRNILRRGSDVALQKRILRAGQPISQGRIGLLAAAGHRTVPVFKKPVVGLVGTGDEIIPPGQPVTEGKLYASNLATLAAWCEKYRMRTRMAIVRDDADAMFRTLKEMSAETDAVLTSGGAWTGDRDMVAGVLERLGWRKHFHRIRIGPGKAVGFGTLDNKPLFILPGTPSSNLVAFLQVALPRPVSPLRPERPQSPQDQCQARKGIARTRAGLDRFLLRKAGTE